MITLHHLHQSRSFRVVWLMEELGLTYDLVVHDRMPDGLSAGTLGAVHLLGKSPTIQDDETVLFESGAILEYVIHRYGKARLAVPPHHMTYPRFLLWMYASEGTALPALAPLVRAAFGGAPATAAQLNANETMLRVCDDALVDHPYFGGTEFSAADIMMETYVRMAAQFAADACARYPRLPLFLDRVHDRPGYRRAMEITEPDAVPQPAQ